MLTYKKEFVCNNTSITAIVGEDGSLTLDGFDEEYEDTLVALGAERSICKKLMDEWNESRPTALTEYLIDDIRAVVSTVADAVERASLVYANRFMEEPENKELSVSFSTIARAISYVRQIIRVRTDCPRVQWTLFSPDVGAVRSDMELLLGSKIEMSRGPGPKIARVDSLINLYNAAGCLCRSITRINYVGDNLISDLDKSKDTENSWWSYVIQHATISMCNSARSIGFGSDEPYTVAYDSTMDWIIGRFVLGMNSLEAGHRWPALEPL